MDIENIGPALIEQLVEKGLVKTFADIYKLTLFDLTPLEGMGTKSAENVLDSIEKSRTRPLWRFIAALGIPNIGTETAQVLADEFRDLDKIRNATLEELKKALTEDNEPKYIKTICEYMSNLENKEVIRIAVNKHKYHPLWMFIKELGIKGIAEKTVKKIAEKFDSIDDFLSVASDSENLKKRLSKKIIPQSVYDYFHDNCNCSVIDQLIDAGIKPQKPKPKSSNVLAGKTIVVTGSFENYSRGQIEQFIKDNSGKVSSSVSKKTSFVIAGKDPGSKLDKAHQLQVKVIDENEFLQLIQEKPKSKKKSGFLWE
jgi:DNA ligase (NAD+)